MDDVVIYQSRFKLVLHAVAALAFVVSGIFLANQHHTPVNPLGVIVGYYVGVPFFGMCFLFAVYRLLFRKPALIISGEGLFDNASPIAAGMLRWDEISEIYPHEFLGQRMLGIALKDPDSVLARQPLINRCIGKMNNVLVGSPFNIAQVALPMPIDEVLKRIEERRTLNASNQVLPKLYLG